VTEGNIVASLLLMADRLLDPDPLPVDREALRQALSKPKFRVLSEQFCEDLLRAADALGQGRG
jgi:hypothetical protein